MRLPGFSAGSSLHQRNNYYQKSTVDTAANEGITIASWFCDTFPWFPGCGGNQLSCEFTNTETYCTGVVLWCKNHYRCWDPRAGHILRDGGWYVCGTCFGWG
ncbi:hypothetical protein CN520_00560 [Bacillus cereus]|uniref:hypothetical protein n=1 Tax=Bacillus cereus TaxID=1396 RepID=UPI000BEDA69F|nr:hypothetical protein [Bacillus cereus]PDZ39791.1 hypothetical protein CON18_13075 [Bacillus cereus]PES11090.1 hypothetical protein CN494_22550 [Bacillus cereus]PET44031.1 hypothetical protein CN520_00560 [Bacillus cereus]PFA14375.1 hypothetical protein CN377_10790 [Bacillus cereus]PFC37677.1 hypothetical protein CN310_13850 [Bacillus cereus]